MNFVTLDIPEVILIEPRVFEDDRGFMMETWQLQKYGEHGIAERFVQDNFSGSRRGVLRGLHYQVRRAQGKLVSVSLGKVFDVAVDIRRSSRTYGQYVSVMLSSENRFQLWIPPGFAHGFYVLSEWANFSYKCSDYYSPSDERTVIWNDPDVAIQWPLLNDEAPKLSGKDAQGIRLCEAEVYP